MLNQWLCFLILCCGPLVIGLALDSMEKVQETAPPKWVRVGLWVVVLPVGGYYQIFVRDYQHLAVNMLTVALTVVAVAVGIRYFYQGSVWYNLAAYLVLFIAYISAEIVPPVVMLLGGPLLSGDFTQRDMVFYSIIGVVTSNTAMYGTAVLWRRWRLQTQMPRGSWAFVLMPLCLVIPTAMYCVGVYQRRETISALHVASMAGALLLNVVLIGVQFHQAQKEQAERELTQLRRQRREEMAKIRHDYNNLLSSVLGLVRMGKTREAEETVQELLTRVENAGEEEEREPW